MLRQHLDSFGLADAVVQIVADFGKEAVKRLPLACPFLRYQRRYPGDVGLRDLGDIARPILPIIPPSAFLDDFGHDGAGELVKHECALAFAAFAGLAVTVRPLVIVSGCTTAPDASRPFLG